MHVCGRTDEVWPASFLSLEEISEAGRVVTKRKGQPQGAPAQDEPMVPGVAGLAGVDRSIGAPGEPGDAEDASEGPLGDWTPRLPSSEADAGPGKVCEEEANPVDPTDNSAEVRRFLRDHLPEAMERLRTDCYPATVTSLKETLAVLPAIEKGTFLRT